MKLYKLSHLLFFIANSMIQAINKNPNLWQALYNLAVLGLSATTEQINRNPDDILVYINLAIEKNPTFYRSYLIKSLFLYQLKQYTNALDSVNKSIDEAKKDKKEDFFLYYVRGEIFTDLQQYDKAIADYTQSITINPNSAIAYGRRGLAYLTHRKIEQGIQDFNQAIAIEPQDAQHYLGRCAGHYEAGNVEQVIKDCTQAITINPQYVHFTGSLLALARGVASAKKGNMDLAIANFNQVITIDPKNASAYYMRGVAYFSKRNKEQGIKDLETAKQLFQQQGNIKEYQKVQEFLNKYRNS